MKFIVFISCIILLLFSCTTDEITQADVSESEMIVFNEELLAQPIADDLGFAAITYNDGIIYLTRFDNDGRKTYLANLAERYPDLFSYGDSVERQLIPGFDGYFMVINDVTGSKLTIIQTDYEGNEFGKIDLNLTFTNENGTFDLEYLSSSPTITGGFKVIFEVDVMGGQDLFLRIVEFPTIKNEPIGFTETIENARSISYIVPTLNGGYGVVIRRVNMPPNVENWLLILNDKLEVQAADTLTDGDLQIFSMLADSEGMDYLIAGFKNDNGSLTSELFVVNDGEKFDELSLSFTGGKIDYFHDVIEVNGGYLFVGNEASPNNISWNSIYDLEESDMVWDFVTLTDTNREFIEKFESEYPTVGGAVKLRDNGGYLLLGSIKSFNIYNNTFMLKTSPAGTFSDN